MDIRKRLFISRVITVCAMTVVMMLPYVVEAVSIGEITAQSGLGEPLLAQVDLVVESSERIADACLSLAAPDPAQENVSSFLTEANLAFKTVGKRQNAHVQLRLQIKCPGMRSVIKMLTISPSVAREFSGEPIDDSRIAKISAQVLLKRYMAI